MKALNETDRDKSRGSQLASLAIGALLAALAPQFCFAADEAVPWQTIPSGLDLPTNAIVHPPPLPLPFPGSPEPPPPIEPSVSFTGLNDNNTRIPPDTYGAMGPNHVVTMLNTQVRISDRTGTNIYRTVSLSNFWGSVGGLRFPVRR